MDFSKFDKEVNTKELVDNVNEAIKKGGTGTRGDVPKGTYTTKVEKLELGTTKDGRPMVTAWFRILEGDWKKSCLFANRVVYGTKNDANAIASVIGWLKTFEPSEDIKVEFESYSQLADLCMDIAEDVADLEYIVDYDPDQYNNISISDILED
jgi:hypothetical protein